MSNLQRRSFECLKQGIESPSELDNFKLHLDTCDIRTVSLRDKALGRITYERVSIFFFFWSEWECTIEVDGVEVKEKVADKSVIEDIIAYKEEVRRINKQAEIEGRRNDRERLMEVLEAGE